MFAHSSLQQYAHVGLKSALMPTTVSERRTPEFEISFKYFLAPGKFMISWSCCYTIITRRLYIMLRSNCPYCIHFYYSVNVYFIYAFYCKLSSSRSHRFMHASLGSFKSPLGDTPTEPIFGPSGKHERLNCCVKKRL